MSEAPRRVVFDCVIFAQALINDLGPAGQCLELARSSTIRLALSEYVIAEIRELPSKLPARLMVTTERVEAFLQDVVPLAEMIGDVPEVYQHPVGADDSHYVNLALAAAATLITSRDHHLLDLMDQSQPLGHAFRQQFPQLDILRPEELLRRLRQGSTRERATPRRREPRAPACSVREWHCWASQQWHPSEASARFRQGTILRRSARKPFGEVKLQMRHLKRRQFQPIFTRRSWRFENPGLNLLAA